MTLGEICAGMYWADLHEGWLEHFSYLLWPDYRERLENGDCED